MTKTIWVTAETWLAFKSKAIGRGVRVRDAIGEALRMWTESDGAPRVVESAVASGTGGGAVGEESKGPTLGEARKRLGYRA